MRSYLLACVLMFTAIPLSAQDRIIFPHDPAVINIRDFGAKGDGKTDDTAAIQHAIRSIRKTKWTRVIYFPNGTYIITEPIRFDYYVNNPKRSMRQGPWLYGETRDGVVLKVPDNSPAFADLNKPAPVIQAHPHAGTRKTSADWFDRIMVNFTVDCGNNPGAIGIRFYSNNTGLLRDVVIKGSGVIGLDFGFISQNGPLLAQRIRIEGFQTGLQTGHSINSQTVSDIEIVGWTKHAVDNNGQVLTVENLQATPTEGEVVHNKHGVLTLINEKPGLEKKNVVGDGVHFVRIGTGEEQVEWTRKATFHIGEGRARSLGLEIKQAPDFAYDLDLNNWVCANDYGMKAGDKQDDAPALQQAINVAAAAGKTTVYIRGLAKDDPNWYLLKQEVSIHGSVRHILGLGFPRIVGGGRMVISEQSAPLVKIENIKVHSPTAFIRYEHRSPTGTLILENSNGQLDCTGGGDTFVFNFSGNLTLAHPGVRVWARQLNPEKTWREDRVNCLNDGGTLWALGVKTESSGTKFKTINGGETEILGAHLYTNRPIEDDMPYFHVIDSRASFAGIKETYFHRKPYRYMVVADQHGEVTQHTKPKVWALMSVDK